MTEMVLVNPHIFPYDFRGQGEWNSNRALNYGLLSIATYLYKKGIQVDILDLQGEREPLAKLENYLQKENPRFVGIGCVSALSYLPTLEIAKYVKDMDPGICVGVGGQHTRFIIEEVFKESDNSIDIVATGEGEETVRQIYSWLKGDINLSDVGGIAVKRDNRTVITPSNKPVDYSEISPIEYSLYPDYKDFFPLIEDSRGCPYRCNFCSNENVFGARIRLKDPDIVVKEIHKIAELYGTKSLPLIFYNSIFGVNPKIAKEIITKIRKSGLDIRFLTSTRVDSGWKMYVDDLEGLCDQMHFGLESASPEILLRMDKTRDPERYISSAKDAVREFHKRGVHVALNILTGFCGENEKTLKETENFLEENKDYIDSIRSHPLMLFPGSPFLQRMKEFEENFGSRISRNKYSDRIHAYPVDATSNFTFEDAIDYGKELMQRFNSFEKFYGYYKWLVGPVQISNGIGFLKEQEFMKLLKDIDPSKFDFGKGFK